MSSQRVTRSSTKAKRAKEGAQGTDYVAWSLLLSCGALTYYAYTPTSAVHAVWEELGAWSHTDPATLSRVWFYGW
jgi:hypothetical protein